MEPRFAGAHAALADTHILDGIYGYAAEAKAYPEAERHALRALELDAECYEAHTAIGAIALFHRWDWSGAERRGPQSSRLQRQLWSSSSAPRGCARRSG